VTAQQEPTLIGLYLLFPSTVAALSLVTVMAFSILRPKNKVSLEALCKYFFTRGTVAIADQSVCFFANLKLIYAPKTKYSTPEKQPPKVDDGLFSW
jgi:hypothetical protein